MPKRITNIVTETQQEIRAKIEVEDGEFTVVLDVSSKLDDDLKEAFHDYVDSLEDNWIELYSRPYRSNQGNELFQRVTASFAREDQLRAIERIQRIINEGKAAYQEQLERDLADDDTVAQRGDNQQMFFEHDALEEFCYLYRGGVEI